MCYFVTSIHEDSKGGDHASTRERLCQRLYTRDTDTCSLHMIIVVHTVRWTHHVIFSHIYIMAIFVRSSFMSWCCHVYILSRWYHALILSRLCCSNIVAIAFIYCRELWALYCHSAVLTWYCRGISLRNPELTLNYFAVLSLTVFIYFFPVRLSLINMVWLMLHVWIQCLSNKPLIS